MAKSGSHNTHVETSSVSGFVADEFEGVNDAFTQFESIDTAGHNALAKAKRFGRWYLLKGLKAEFREQAVYREALRKEFDIMMRLQHPGIVNAVGIEEVDDMGMCIVMEWVEGATLKQWLTTNPSRNERRQVLNHLLETVEYLHSLDIAHRDLKPSNIMVTNIARNIKIIDFGLADTDVHATLKQPGGTVNYMAPEQATTAVPDVRNDIYSLGVIISQMKLGRAYDNASMRCLRPIDDRFQNVEELRDYLSRSKRIGRWLTIAAAVAFAAIMALVVVWQQNRLNDFERRSSIVTDSLRNELARNSRHVELNKTQIEEAHSSTTAQMSQLTDSLKRLSVDNAMLRTREKLNDERQRAIDQAIIQGVKIAKEANEKTQLMQHLDTMSTLKYLWPDWQNLRLQGRFAANQYLLTLRSQGQFSNKELAIIEYGVMEYCSDYERKLDKLFSFPQYIGR